jgi:hypothetical protein
MSPNPIRPSRLDEVQTADPGLCGMDVAEVVPSGDDPEFLVASREIENLLAVLEHNQSRKAQLGIDRNATAYGSLLAYRDHA